MLHRPSPRTAAPPLHRQDTVHATIPAPRNKDSRPLQTTCSHTYACLTMPRTRAVRKTTQPIVSSPLTTRLHSDEGPRKQRIGDTILPQHPENTDFLLLLCDIPNHTR